MAHRRQTKPGCRCLRTRPSDAPKSAWNQTIDPKMSARQATMEADSVTSDAAQKIRQAIDFFNRLTRLSARLPEGVGEHSLPRND